MLNSELIPQYLFQMILRFNLTNKFDEAVAFIDQVRGAGPTIWNQVLHKTPERMALELYNYKFCDGPLPDFIENWQFR